MTRLSSHKDITIKPMTKEDLDALGGFHRSCRGYSAFYKGTLACIAGIFVDHGNIIVFSVINKDIDLPKRITWIGAQMLMEKIKSFNKPLFAIAQPEFSNAPKLLSKLGFTHYKDTEEGSFWTWLTPLHG